MELGGVGVWSTALRYGAKDEAAAAAAELESGYSALWFPDAFPREGWRRLAPALVEAG